MDHKALAQQATQEILGYNQDTSGRKVVKTSVRKHVKYVSRVCFLVRNNSFTGILKIFFYNRNVFFTLGFFVLSFFFSVSDS